MKNNIFRGLWLLNAQFYVSVLGLGRAILKIFNNAKSKFRLFLIYCKIFISMPYFAIRIWFMFGDYSYKGWKKAWKIVTAPMKVMQRIMNGYTWENGKEVKGDGSKYLKAFDKEKKI